MARTGDKFKSGDRIPTSGVYRVTHQTGHASPHENICLFGREFPHCIGCKNPEFELVRPATQIEQNENFHLGHESRKLTPSL